MTETLNQEEMMKLVQELLEERGRKVLEMSRKKVLKEQIESEEVRKALEYFMIEYWHDVARPALLSLVCESVGGDPDTTTPIAIPMSLISGAIDIHDDIIDQSKSKWSRPTIFGKFGKDVALLTGDCLLFKGFTLLSETIGEEIPLDKKRVIIEMIKKAFFDLGVAETIELKFRGRTNVSPEEYLSVVRKKAADVEAHTRIGAILGNGTKKEIEALGIYGRLLGMLLILNDDIADMSDSDELLHRIRNEHLPLQVIYALEKNVNKNEIGTILSKTKKTKNDVKRIVSITKRSEGLAKITEIMKNLAEKAITQIKNVPNNKQYLQLLVEALIP
jgi:geranylgeranyl pyrophosphate synthase